MQWKRCRHPGLQSSDACMLSTAQPIHGLLPDPDTKTLLRGRQVTSRLGTLDHSNALDGARMHARQRTQIICGACSHAAPQGPAQSDISQCMLGVGHPALYVPRENVLPSLLPRARDTCRCQDPLLSALIWPSPTRAAPAQHSFLLLRFLTQGTYTISFIGRQPLLLRDRLEAVVLQHGASNRGALRRLPDGRGGRPNSIPTHQIPALGSTVHVSK